jgi:hypothetical protein
MPFTSKDIFISPVYNPNTGDASAAARVVNPDGQRVIIANLGGVLL